MKLNKEYLFTTSDNVPIHIGDEYYYIAKGRIDGVIKWKLYGIHCCSGHDSKKGTIQFYSRHLAEEHLKTMINE